MVAHLVACLWGALSPLGDVVATNPRASVLRAAMTGCGYVAVPLRRGRVSGWWFVDVVIEGRRTALMLDTGASGYGSFSLTAARRLGLRPIGPVSLSSTPDIRNIPTYHEVYIGVRVGPHARVVPFQVIDNDWIHTLEPGDGIDNSSGLLGTVFLSHYSAVIDYPSATLYLLDPRRREPGLAGEWEAVEMTSKGERTRFRSGARRLTFGDELRLFRDGEASVVSYTLDSTPGVRAMQWHHRYTDAGRKPGGWSDRYLYRLTGDELVLCGRVYNRRSADGFPLVKIDGSVASPYDVVTFRRVRERAPAPRPVP